MKCLHAVDRYHHLKYTKIIDTSTENLFPIKLQNVLIFYLLLIFIVISLFLHLLRCYAVAKAYSRDAGQRHIC